MKEEQFATEVMSWWFARSRGEGQPLTPIIARYADQDLVRLEALTEQAERLVQALEDIWGVSRWKEPKGLADKILVKVRQHAASVEHALSQGPEPMSSEEALDLATGVLALDVYLSGGGKPPEAWTRAVDAGETSGPRGE